MHEKWYQITGPITPTGLIPSIRYKSLSCEDVFNVCLAEHLYIHKCINHAPVCHGSIVMQNRSAVIVTNVINMSAESYDPTDAHKFKYENIVSKETVREPNFNFIRAHDRTQI